MQATDVGLYPMIPQMARVPQRQPKGFGDPGFGDQLSAREKFSDLFDCHIPEVPENKRLTPEEQRRFKSMWPAGEHEAQARLEKFKTQKMNKYSEQRNLPAANATAVERSPSSWDTRGANLYQSCASRKHVEEAGRWPRWNEGLDWRSRLARLLQARPRPLVCVYEQVFQA